MCFSYKNLIMKEVIKKNFKAFGQAFKVPKVNNFVLRKPYQLKYTFIPILLVVSYLYFYVDAPVENYIWYNVSGTVSYYADKITHFGLAIYMLVPLGVLVLVRVFIDADKLSEKVRIYLSTINGHAWFLIATVSISGIIGQVLKIVIGRARPKFFLEYGSHYFQHFHKPGYDFASMPSGHSITVAAFFMGLIYLAPRFRVLWVF